MLILMFGLFTVLGIYISELQVAKIAEFNYQELNVVEASLIYTSGAGAAWPYAYKADGSARTTPVDGDCPHQHVAESANPSYLWKLEIDAAPVVRPASVHYARIMLFKYEGAWASLSDAQKQDAINGLGKKGLPYNVIEYLRDYCTYIADKK